MSRACTDSTTGTKMAWGLIALALLAFLFIWKVDPWERCGLKHWFEHGVKVGLIVLGKSWPRIKQSFRILVTNVQVGDPRMCRYLWFVILAYRYLAASPADHLPDRPCLCHRAACKLRQGAFPPPACTGRQPLDSCPRGWCGG